MKQKLRPGFARALIVVAVVGLFALLVAFLGRGPYGFLDQFKSERVTMEKPYLVNVGLAPPPKASAREYGLVFSPADAPAILDTLKRELTPKNGYTVKDEMKTNPYIVMYASVRDQIWSFKTSADEGVVYAYGSFADTYRGVALVQGSGKDYTPGFYNPACVVIITHNQTWWDNTIGALRSFLHLE